MTNFVMTIDSINICNKPNCYNQAGLNHVCRDHQSICNFGSCTELSVKWSMCMTHFERRRGYCTHNNTCHNRILTHRLCFKHGGGTKCYVKKCCRRATHKCLCLAHAKKISMADIDEALCNSAH